MNSVEKNALRQAGSRPPGQNLFGALFAVQPAENRLGVGRKRRAGKNAVDQAAGGVVKGANLALPVAEKICIDRLDAAGSSHTNQS